MISLVGMPTSEQHPPISNKTHMDLPMRFEVVMRVPMGFLALHVIGLVWKALMFLSIAPSAF